MKLALVHKHYGRVGGTEGFLLGLSRGLAERGHELDVFAASVGVSDSESTEAVPIRLRRLGGRGGGWLPTLALMATSALRVRRRNYDQVLHLGRTGPGGIYRAGGGCHRSWYELLLRRASGPAARFFLWLSQAHRLRLWHERRALRSPTTLVVTPSRQARSDLQSAYGEDAAGVRVVHNGVDLQRFSPDRRSAARSASRARFGIGPDERCVLFVGSDPWRKGLDRVLHAIALLRESGLPSIRLLAIGCERWDGWVHRLVQQLDLGGTVIFGGREEDVLAGYAAADLVVVPTRYDPFANVTLEALACGLPVVTSHCNGAVEAVSDCAALAVLDTAGPEPFAAAMERFLRPGSERGWSESARRAAESCGLPAAVAQWELLLREACPDQGARHG